MSTIEEIENAVSKLPAEQLAAFRAWFAQFDAAGKLDALAKEALRDSKKGRCSSL
jgi:hypothetical protein